MRRGERCAACGRPTYAGEDFDGPCVYDSDLACALAQRDNARAELEVAQRFHDVAVNERDVERTMNRVLRAEAADYANRLAEARIEAAAEMRERAAVAVECALTSGLLTPFTARHVIGAVRALPLPGDE